VIAPPRTATAAGDNAGVAERGIIAGSKSYGE